MTTSPSSTPLRLAAALLVSGAALAVAAGCASSARFDGPGGDARLYGARCGLCHVPYPPAHFAPSEWPGIVAVMGPRAGLDTALRERVTRYLVAESAASRR